MRQDSARVLTSPHGLGVVVVALTASGDAFGQSVRASAPGAAAIQSIQPISAPLSPAREPMMVLKPQAPVEGGVTNPFFNDCVFIDDFILFTPQPDDVGDPPVLVPLQDGGTGITWATGRDFVGMANDALFTALGGMPPTGAAPNGAMVDRYIAVARETLGTTPITTFSLGMSARAFAPLKSDPRAALQAVQLVYLQTDDGVPDTHAWWSPVSFLESLIHDRIFFGGVFEDGSLSPFTNEADVLDRFVSLAPHTPFEIPTLFGSGEHPAFQFPTDQWFAITSTLVQSPGGGLGRGSWVKSVDTANTDPPFIDPRMATGDIVPPDGDPVGWICTYPGFTDDPKTTDVIEGIGLATTSLGELPGTGGAYNLAGAFVAFTLDGVQYGVGSDPEGVSGHTPNDYFFGPLCISGIEFPTPCVIPDFTLTYTDDLESYFGGQPIEFQTLRWFSSSSSNPVVLKSQNTTPGGSQSIAEQNTNNDSAFRLTHGTAVPRAATAKPGTPIVASVQMRLNPTTRTGRALVLRDERFGGAFAARIFLGGTDPTAQPTMSNGLMYVRQPNPAFDPTQPPEDNQVQQNWINPEDWESPPSKPLNLRHILVPTGLTITPGDFHEVCIEIESTSLDPDEPPVMRVFVNGTEQFPFGDSNQTWTAESPVAGTIEFWSGHEVAGQFDTLTVDDVFFNGAPAFMAFGPGFLSPFADDFSAYPLADTIDGHGFTSFLDESTVPDFAETSNEPQLTIIPSPAFNPEPGEDVCRFELVEVCLDELDVLPEEGATIAVRHTSLPPSPDGSTINCPGAIGTNFSPGFPFVVRTSDANVRIGVGKWSLLTADPVPYDPNSGDAIGFDYLFGYEPIWRVAEPQKQGVVTTDPVEGVNQVLRIINPGAIDTSTGRPTQFESVDALLPKVTASPVFLPNPAVFNELAFDLYIEGIDSNGDPAIAPPRSRLILPVESADGGRIAEVVFGGPSPNNISTDAIRFIAANGMEGVTGVSLIDGGEGVIGPLINTWFRVIVRVDHNGTWDLMIDEDRDGPLAPVSIQTGDAIDADLETVDFSMINAFRLEQGRDVGGDGEPVPLPLIVQSKQGGWQAIGPSDADQYEDYCFYATMQEFFEHPTNPPLIGHPETALQGLIEEVAPLSQNHDVIAVLNRRTNPDNTVAGNPIVHDPCPDESTTLMQFQLLDDGGSEIVYEGAWRLMSAPDDPKGNIVRPAGGLSRPDGTSQDPPVSYNDPIVEPPGYPATLAPRAIMLADWASDQDDGVPSELAPLPPSRWYVDNVSLRNVNGPTPCADIGGDPTQVDGADLAQLLSQWGAAADGNPADFNGDSVVNGADLAILLANWGPCP